MNNKLIQIVLSLFLIYHLLAIFILPNFNSILGETVGPYVLKYATTLNISNTWQFFSPNPSMEIFWEYELEYNASVEDSLSDEVIEKEMKVYRWPPLTSDEFYRVSFMRKVYHSRNSTQNQKSIRNFLIPWLCKKHPEAKSIFIRTVVKAHSNILQPELMNRMTQLQQAYQKRLNIDSFNCNSSIEGASDA